MTDVLIVFLRFKIFHDFFLKKTLLKYIVYVFKVII